jgi:hypothetical protein
VHRAGKFAFQELARARLQLCHILTSVLRMGIEDCAGHPFIQWQTGIVGPGGNAETAQESEADLADRLQQQIVRAAGKDGPVKTQIRLDSGCAIVGRSLLEIFKLYIS